MELTNAKKLGCVCLGMGFAGLSQSGQQVSSACPWQRWSPGNAAVALPVAFQQIQRVRQDPMQAHQHHMN